MVDVKLKSKLKGIVSLPELRKHADGALKDMVLLNNSRWVAIVVLMMMLRGQVF
jgi:hypothetical protein